MVIRCPVDDIRIARRRSQGVVIFKVGDGERVVSVAGLPEDSEENGEANGSDNSAENRQINEGNS
jgi:DNA gyrase subunit A